MRELRNTKSHRRTREVCFDGGSNSQGSDDDFHVREKEPQGLLYFTRYDSVPIMTKSLFGFPTSREFTKSELAEKSDLTPRSVSNRIDILLELGIIKEVEGADRYTINLDGEITWKLRELDGLIKKAQSEDSPPLRKSSEDEFDRRNLPTRTEGAFEDATQA